MRAVSELNGDLARTEIVRASEGQAVIEQEAAGGRV